LQKSKPFGSALNNLRKIYKPSGKTGIIKSTSMKRTIFVGLRKEMESGQRLKKHCRLKESSVIMQNRNWGKQRPNLGMFHSSCFWLRKTRGNESLRKSMMGLGNIGQPLNFNWKTFSNNLVKR
jgi:hypothetical protein